MSTLDRAHLETAVRARFRAEPPPAARAEAHLRGLVLEENPLLDDSDLAALVERLVAQVCGYGVLQQFCDDPAVTDIVVNGPGPVWVERGGTLERTDAWITADELEAVIERMLGPLGKRVDRVCPIVDGRLADGSRVCVVIPPLAVGGPFVAIRRFSTRSLPLSAFAEPPLVARIAELIDGRANIVVFGPTGSGKTTLLNALASSLPAGRRIITIEDTAELRIAHPHVIGLEARTANAEGAGAASIRSLIRAALRMRPDHLVVGEVRGAEALDMIWALSTGHDGSLSTCHASSADDVLARLETFALLGDAALPHEAIRRQLRAAVDVVIGVRRREDGRRTISEVASVSRDLNGAPTVSLLDGSAKRDAP